MLPNKFVFHPRLSGIGKFHHDFTDHTEDQHQSLLNRIVIAVTISFADYLPINLSKGHAKPKNAKIQYVSGSYPIEGYSF